MKLFHIFRLRKKKSEKEDRERALVERTLEYVSEVLDEVYYVVNEESMVGDDATIRLMGLTVLDHITMINSTIRKTNPDKLRERFNEKTTRR